MAPPIAVTRKISTGSTPKSSRTKVKRSLSFNETSVTRKNAGLYHKKTVSCSCEAINEIGRVNTVEWQSTDGAPFITLPFPGESVDVQEGKNQTNKSQQAARAENEDVTSTSFTKYVKWVEDLDVTVSDVKGTHTFDSCSSNPSAEKEGKFNVDTETDCSGNLSSDTTWSHGNGARVEKQNKLFCPERNVRQIDGPAIEHVKVRTLNTSPMLFGYTKGSILSRSRNAPKLCTINEENYSSSRDDGAAAKNVTTSHETQPVLLRCKMTLSSNLPGQRWSIAGSGVQDSPNLKGMAGDSPTGTSIAQTAVSDLHLTHEKIKSSSNEYESDAEQTHTDSKESLTSINVLDKSQSLLDLSHDRSHSLLDLSQCMSPEGKWESPNIRLGKTMSMNRPKESKPVGLRRTASFNFSFRGSSEKLVWGLLEFVRLF